jgi:hypothetical protein
MAAIIDIVSFYCSSLAPYTTVSCYDNKQAKMSSLVYFKKSFKNELNDNNEERFKCKAVKKVITHIHIAKREAGMPK